MRIILIACVALLLGAAGGYLRWHQTPESYVDVRARMVRMLVDQSGPVDTLAIGDSITESTLLDGACGRTFNAAVASSRLVHVERMAEYAVPRLKPETIILAVGSNHFWEDKDTGLFEKHYARVVGRLRAGHLILVGLTNNPKANVFIERLAKERGAAYVAPVLDHIQADGVHITPAGARIYRQRIEKACR